MGIYLSNVCGKYKFGFGVCGREWGRWWFIDSCDFIDMYFFVVSRVRGDDLFFFIVGLGGLGGFGGFMGRMGGRGGDRGGFFLRGFRGFRGNLFGGGNV